jgi:hypothetical protein
MCCRRKNERGRKLRGFEKTQVRVDGELWLLSEPNESESVSKKEEAAAAAVFMHHCDMLYLPAQDAHLCPVAGISKVQW